MCKLNPSQVYRQVQDKIEQLPFKKRPEALPPPPTQEEIDLVLERSKYPKLTSEMKPVLEKCQKPLDGTWVVSSKDPNFIEKERVGYQGDRIRCEVKNTFGMLQSRGKGRFRQRS